MNLTNPNTVTAPFPEIKTTTSENSKNQNYDIIFDGKITLIEYCNLLLDKVFELKQSQFPAFVNYQINQNSEPERG